jgi:hypothetical protein
MSLLFFLPFLLVHTTSSACVLVFLHVFVSSDLLLGPTTPPPLCSFPPSNLLSSTHLTLRLLSTRFSLQSIYDRLINALTLPPFQPRRHPQSNNPPPLKDQIPSLLFQPVWPIHPFLFSQDPRRTPFFQDFQERKRQQWKRSQRPRKHSLSNTHPHNNHDRQRRR